MSVQTRDEVQTSEILQDTMPSSTPLDTAGETLTHTVAPYTLAKVYRWLVGISKAVLGEATRRNGSKRVQGLEQTLTGKITSASTAVTGSSTLFQTELFVGAFIAGVAGEYREVAAISSDTSLTLVAAFSSDIGSAQLFTRLQMVSERLDTMESFVNAALNGDLGSWNQGTSFSTPASDTQLADNFYAHYDGSIGTFVVSQNSFTIGQTDVPLEPQYYLRWNQTAAGSAQTIKQLRYKLSGVRSFAGQTMQATFYAKMGSGADITVGCTQNFGTGGSPSADVVIAAKTRTMLTAFSRHTVTLAIPSISGKSLGSNADDAIYLNFNLPLNTVHDFYLSNLSVYTGTAEIPFKQPIFNVNALTYLKSILKAYFDTLYARPTYITAQATSTRVTATPTALGQYRSYLRNAGVRTYTETNGTPTTVPSSTNGFKLYDGNIYATADNNNEPTRYDIFIGTGKLPFIEFYRSTGRTGFVCVLPVVWGGLYDSGVFYNYDPTSGVFTILKQHAGGADPAIGVDENGVAFNAAIYFDIKC